MTDAANHRAGDLVRAELSRLAREWGVRPLIASEEASYTAVLMQHNAVDVQQAFRHIREAGVGRAHSMLPMLFSIVGCVRSCYEARTAEAKPQGSRREAA